MRSGMRAPALSLAPCRGMQGRLQRSADPQEWTAPRVHNISPNASQQCSIRPVLLGGFYCSLRGGDCLVRMWHSFGFHEPCRGYNARGWSAADAAGGARGHGGDRERCQRGAAGGAHPGGCGPCAAGSNGGVSGRHAGHGAGQGGPPGVPGLGGLPAVNGKGCRHRVRIYKREVLPTSSQKG